METPGQHKHILLHRATNNNNTNKHKQAQRMVCFASPCWLPRGKGEYRIISLSLGEARRVVADADGQ